MNRSPPILNLLLAFGAASAIALSASSCFQTPEFPGPYRCTSDPANPCIQPGLVCDLGLCCKPGGEPVCPSYVLDGGLCQNGSQATAYYDDQDKDTYGNNNTLRYLCLTPPLDAGFVTQGNDCNDNPAAGGPLVNPAAQEQCDGIDNNCNQQTDEGFPERKLWYLDTDQDGHGDPATATAGCYPPDGGYVLTGDDCSPGNPSIYPGAPCTVPGVAGACKQSQYTCNNGTPSCQQTVSPKQEVCNGVDDNCEGRTDEQPWCGGPAVFAQDVNVTFNVRHLASAFGGVPTGCVMNAANHTPADTIDPTDVFWTGTGGESHVLWARATSGAWDLSAPGLQLRVPFTYSISSSIAAGSNVWNEHHQPVVLICSANGHIRLVPTNYPIGWTSRSGTLDLLVDLRGSSGSGWAVGSGSTQPLDNVLKQATRVEIMIEQKPASPPATFNVNFDEGRFGFRRPATP
jgi:hypothetical protein